MSQTVATSVTCEPPTNVSARRQFVLYVAPDCTDSAVRKRALGFMELGHELVSFSFRRHRYNANYQTEWTNIELGSSQERRLIARIGGLFHALRAIVRHRQVWQRATIVYARNLDLALLALLAQMITRSHARLVYEILDIHPLLTRGGLLCRIFRWLERIVLRRASMLVVSSEAYLREYFQPIQHFSGTAFVFENRWPKALLPARTTQQRRVHDQLDRTWTIGWFGNIRCRESLQILLDVADALPDKSRIYLRGHASLLGRGVIEKAIAGRKNVVFAGEYVAPEDLAEIYSHIDFNWCGDFGDGDNSRWLLPNRLYEGGYYGVPAIGIEGHETGKVIVERQWGIAVAAPYAEDLIHRLTQLTVDQYDTLRNHVQSQPDDVFADTNDIRRLFDTLGNQP